MPITGTHAEGFSDILTPAAITFVEGLVRRFGPRRDTLLAARAARQGAIDAGGMLGFDPETAALRAAEWTVPPAPADLRDRRVEITGPVDRKMIINALNSGASCFMAHLEDANAPTWHNLMEGQQNLKDAVRRTLRWDDPTTGRAYRLNASLATLIVRPRGWHLPEAHWEVDGAPAPAALVDAGLYLFHNAGAGPLYLYLPKMEHGAEAALWNDVLDAAEADLRLAPGSVRVTCLIETLPAAFQMHEILHALRSRVVGLNCGRWDYIFSTIKTFRADPSRVMPDRGQVGMTQPFLRAYTQLLIQTCHRRGAHAIGGMAADIPIKTDPVANAAALERVRQDKLREVKDGHDGTWVAHPGLVPVAKEVFDTHMPGPNQLSVLRDDVRADADLLTQRPAGTCTWEGVRLNVDVGVRYLEAWLRGNGCVPLHNRMEDAATAEISRAQLWQQVHHGARLDDGRTVDLGLVSLAVTDCAFPEDGRFPDALRIFRALVAAPTCPDFLTLAAYPHLSE